MHQSTLPLTGGDSRREKRRGRTVDRTIAATGDLVQRPQRQPVPGKPRVDLLDPKRDHGRHTPALAFDLADTGAQCLDGGFGKQGPNPEGRMFFICFSLAPKVKS